MSALPPKATLVAHFGMSALTPIADTPDKAVTGAR
jgi:hypothetical protein